MPVIGGPSNEELLSTNRPDRKAPMTSAPLSYTTFRDVTNFSRLRLSLRAVKGELLVSSGSHA